MTVEFGGTVIEFIGDYVYFGDRDNGLLLEGGDVPAEVQTIGRELRAHLESYRTRLEGILST